MTLFGYDLPLVNSSPIAQVVCEWLFHQDIFPNPNDGLDNLDF